MEANDRFFYNEETPDPVAVLGNLIRAQADRINYLETRLDGFELRQSYDLLDILEAAQADYEADLTVIDFDGGYEPDADRDIEDPDEYLEYWAEQAAPPRLGWVPMAARMAAAVLIAVLIVLAL